MPIFGTTHAIITVLYVASGSMLRLGNAPPHVHRRYQPLHHPMTTQAKNTTTTWSYSSPLSTTPSPICLAERRTHWPPTPDYSTNSSGPSPPADILLCTSCRRTTTNQNLPGTLFDNISYPPPPRPGVTEMQPLPRVI